MWLKPGKTNSISGLTSKTNNLNARVPELIVYHAFGIASCAVISGVNLDFDLST